VPLSVPPVLFVFAVSGNVFVYPVIVLPPFSFYFFGIFPEIILMALLYTAAEAGKSLLKRLFLFDNNSSNEKNAR
jgi:hypothetical protein